MSRRRWLIIGMLGIGVAIGLLVWALVPATRFVYGVAPIGRDEAVLLTRRNEDHATYFWVQLVREDGAVAWSTETSPFRALETLGFSGAVASEDRVVLLGELGQQDARTVVMALSRATGERLWETEVASSGGRHIGPALTLDGPRVYALHQQEVGERSEDTITALALEDGAVLWTLEPSEEDANPMRVALVGPGRLVVTSLSADEGIELDGVTGETRRSVPFYWQGCETPHGLVSANGLEVVRVPGPAADGRETSARSFELGTDVRPILDGPCGERGDDIVIGAELGLHEHGIVRLDREDGTVRWRLSLGRTLFQRGISLDGRLPRFLPVAVFGREVENGPSVEDVVVVDLDQGTVLSRDRIDDHVVAFVTAERAHVMGLSRQILVTLDPETGAIASATRFTGTTANEVIREDYRFGQLWLYGMGWGGPEALSWAIVDLDAGARIRVHGEIATEDVTAQGWPGPR